MNKVKSVNEINLDSSKVAYSSFSGEILINKNVIKDYDTNERTFILLHEAGHIELQTENEHEADAYAFFEYKKLGLPLHSILSAMEKALTDKPINRERKLIMQKRIESKSNLQSFDAGDWKDWLKLIAGGSGLAVEQIEKNDPETIAQEKEIEKEKEKKKKRTALILAGAGVVLIVVLFLVMRKK